jgi:hypothetical protein
MVATFWVILNLIVATNRVILNNPALHITPHIALVIHIQPVIVKTIQYFRRLDLQVLHVLPEMSSALPHSPKHPISRQII